MDAEGDRAGLVAAPAGAAQAGAERRAVAEPLAFLRGGGEMGALMRGTDWASTALGAAAAWPQSLKTAVSICLASGFPVLLWWGRDLRMLYNDAYRQLVGDKHPRSLGQAGRDCWPEIWDTIGPMLAGVLDEGRTTYVEDLMLPLHRRGFPEECYFTFTYSPIRDESGEVGGVFCAVTETTQRVYGARHASALRDLAAPRPAPAAAARVLVADDDADMRAYLSGILSRRWTVEVVADGTAALAAARAAPPDLVLTDVMMPGLDGFELLRQLRADPATREIPVVVLSARAGEEARVDGAAAGADDYLVKPFSARELTARIATHLELARVRREATRALRDSEARFREIADVAPVVLWVTAPDGSCTFVSSRWRELTGQDPAAGLGHGWLGAVHPEDVTGAREAFLDAHARRAGFRSEYRVRGGAGWRWALALGAPRQGPGGEFLGLVGSVVDITERRAAEEAVRESDRRKNEFLAVLSHELRNPLAPIRNGIYLLTHAPAGSAAEARAREILTRQAQHLTRLVDDLLDITRVTHGKVELALTRLDAREVVRRACGDLREEFAERGIELVHAEVPEPAWVDADEARLAQMVGNLLHNALQFTQRSGRVEVAVRRRGARCEVVVRDTGMGIAPADLERIFEPFVQAERTRGRAQGGMGVGLALVRELAAKHGGAVRGWSAGEGQGAEFTLELPLAAAPGAAAGGEAARAGSAAPLRVLLVEDNEDAGATLADVLELAGHQVERVTTGRAGIEAATARPPDALVCDVGLPDLSGHEVVRAVRAALPDVPLLAIALTGYAQPRDRALALAAGFDAHLPKPPPLDALEALLALASVRRRPASVDETCTRQV